MEEREISFSESKQILLEIFRYIDQLCRDHHLTYSLCSGTMLGAVRHHGFIPWDDDIDIMMPRYDFEKFLTIHKDGKYRVFHENIKENYWNSVIRVTDPRTEVYFGDNTYSKHGLWVALIPIDNVPDKSKQWQLQKKLMAFWIRMCRIKIGRFSVGHNLKGLIKKIWLKYTSITWLNHQLKKVMMRYDGKPSKQVFKLNFYYDPCVYPAYWYDKYIELDFEGIKAKAIAYYDEYLQEVYGDYMTLPPINEQIPKHNYKALWKSNTQKL